MSDFHPTGNSGSQAQGLALLAEYVDSHVFVHDDYDPSHRASDWEGYDTAPFLLGAKQVIGNSTTASLFGEAYADTFRSLGFSAELALAVPAEDGRSLSERIASSTHLTDVFAQITSGYDLSVFENRQEHEGALVARLGDDRSTTVSPPDDTFRALNTKVGGREFLEELGVPMPLGVVCDSLADISRFLKLRERVATADILVKVAHRKLYRLSTNDELMALKADGSITRESFPLIAEAYIHHTASPIAQAIAWNKTVAPLHFSDQLLAGLLHVGNQWPARDDGDVMTTYALEVASALPHNYGVVGVDFIMTKDGPLAVDVNPRFCSSTYPQVAYTRLGFGSDSVAITGQTTAIAATLSDLVPSLPILARNRNGVLLYCPRPGESKGSIRFSYLAVGSDLDGAHDLVHQIRCVSHPQNRRKT